MSKPIFIVKIPQETYENHPDHIVGLSKGLEKRLDDYHVLFMFDNRREDVQFECFNSNDVDDIKFAELKKMVLESIETVTNKKL